MRNHPFPRKGHYRFRVLPIFFACYLIMILSLPLASAGSLSHQDESFVDAGDEIFLLIGHPTIAASDFEKFDNVDIRVTVISGGAIDIYLMSCSVYSQKYQNSENFTTVASKQNFTGTATLDWQKDNDDTSYCLVIDNWDNVRDNDALPNGTVKVKYSYDIDNNSHKRELFFISLIAGIICVILIAVTVAILTYKRNRWN